MLIVHCSAYFLLGSMDHYTLLLYNFLGMLAKRGTLRTIGLKYASREKGSSTCLLPLTLSLPPPPHSQECECTVYKVQIQKEIISNLTRENEFLEKEI